jgi:hypothetical protein
MVRRTATLATQNKQPTPGVDHSVKRLTLRRLLMTYLDLDRRNCGRGQRSRPAKRRRMRRTKLCLLLAITCAIPTGTALGASWRVQQVSEDAAGGGVSCLSSTWCLAASGGATIWDGTRWTALPSMPASGLLKDSDLSSISCTSQIACVGVGEPRRLTVRA